MTVSASCLAKSDQESETLQRADGDAIVPDVTLLELVTVASEYAESERELPATIVYMVNGGSVRLCGNFRGARFDLSTCVEA